MKVVRIADVDLPSPERFVARPILEGDQSNVRLIRIAPGNALPPHRHGRSDLVLYAVEGAGELETPTGTEPFSAGALAFYRGDEDLRVSNLGTSELVLLAFLAPKFGAA
jgi:quercetin dioxygenase-like cupin family protein